MNVGDKTREVGAIYPHRWLVTAMPLMDSQHSVSACGFGDLDWNDMSGVMTHQLYCWGSAMHRHWSEDLL